MDEIKFVARCFAFAALVLVLSQLKTGGVTLENRMQASLVNSNVADFVNKSAQGGVKLINTTVEMAKDYIQHKKKTPSAEEVVKKVQAKVIPENQPVIDQDELNSEEE